MEKTKSKLVKSKFSNSTLTKFSPMDNKSRSNATFQTNFAKKRGVYVERKPMKESLNDNADDVTPKEPIKAPKRPSRGQKRFLASVLSLLSKSSTGTQHPEMERKEIPANLDKPENNVVTMIGSDKRKKKYKSKILNSRICPSDTFEVLQYKKNIVTTPSIDFSGDEEVVEDIKWSDFLPRLVKPDPEEIQMERDKKLSHLVKEVTEGRMVMDKRITINVDEPPTLVSENVKHTTKDPGFYNFFVDLLETTFSVYDIKSEYDYQAKFPSAQSSKIAFEIDEAVANKLNVVPVVSRHPSTHFRYKEEPKRELVDYFQDRVPKRSKSPTPKKRNKSEMPKYRTPKSAPRQRFLLPQTVSMRSPPLFPETESMTQKKRFYKKNSKQMLLNMLKEQLSFDNQPFEEPQNLFQALRVLAKNKRKTQKTLRFEKTPDELAAESMFRTRRLVPRRSKLKNGSHRVLASPRPSDFKKQQKRAEYTEDEASNHSLEVVNINYETYTRSKRGKSTVASTYSPTSYSPDFSPVASAENISYERNERPFAPHQVILAVKSRRMSRHFYNERDEALT